MGESQRLPGSCMLLPDPVVPSLNDLPPERRAAYLADMALLGDAVTDVCRPPFSDPLRRLNYEILGNLEPALHAHVIPRFESEPEALRTKAVWLYPPELWNAPEHRYDPSNPRHADTRARLADAIHARLAPCHRSRSRDSGAVRPAATEVSQSADFGDAPLPPLFSKACAFAARAHETHRRKDKLTPYIAHPFRVAMIVRHLGCEDPAALAAAVLHDTLEDTRTDFDDLAEHFGAEVACLVAALSKDKRLPEPDRERAYDDQLSRADWRARLIKLADVLDNADDTDRHPDHPPISGTERAERFRRALAVAGAVRGGHPALDRAAAEVERRLQGREEETRSVGQASQNPCLSDTSDPSCWARLPSAPPIP